MTTPPTDMPPQQAQAPTPAVAHPRRAVIGRTIARGIGMLVLLYLGGPMFWLARGIQEEASAQVWQAERRWARVHGSAFLSLLWYAPLFLFHTPLAAFWATIFGFLARLLHVPFIVLLGDATVFPPTPMNLLLRWVLALPLAPLCATVLELFHPRTVWEFQRVLTPEEREQLARAQAITHPTPKPARSRRAAPTITVVEERPAPSPAPQTTPAPVTQPQNTTTLASTQHQTPGQREVRESRQRPDAVRTTTPRTRQQHENAFSQLLALPQTTQRRPPAPSPARFTWDEGDGIIDDSDTGETQ